MSQRTTFMVQAAFAIYNELKDKLQSGEYVDFTCIVQGFQHVVCNIQELPGNCLMLITVIENGATYIIYAPAEQVCFQIIHGKDEKPHPTREIGFKPYMQDDASATYPSALKLPN
jgi:hypothetical protein